MKKGMIWALALVLLACLIGCGGEPAPRPAEKEGVVYLDPNAVQATAAPTEAPAPAAQPQASRKRSPPWSCTLKARACAWSP